MIQDFRPKGLRQFFETGSTAGIQAPLACKLRLQLAALHSATQIEDMDQPGYRLHLRSIWLNGNWRLTFAFRGTINWDTSKPDGTPKKQLDVSRLAGLGWRARIPLAKGLLSAIEGFRS